MMDSHEIKRLALASYYLIRKIERRVFEGISRSPTPEEFRIAVAEVCPASGLLSLSNGIFLGKTRSRSGEKGCELLTFA
jgi:hypothetical protein